MWRNIRSLPKRWRQERDQQAFCEFFGFPPGWNVITQKLVDNRLDQLAQNLLQIQEHEYFSPAREGMERYFRRAQEIADRCGYVISPLEEHLKKVARKGRLRRSRGSKEAP